MVCYRKTQTNILANPLESSLFPSFPMSLDISSYKFTSSCPTGFLISSMLFYGEGNGTLLQHSCLENPMDGGAWKAAVHGVAEGRTLHFHFSLSCIGEGNGNPLQCSCLENPRDGGAWWAAVYGVTQSRTQLSNLAAAAAAELKQ